MAHRYNIYGYALMTEFANAGPVPGVFIHLTIEANIDSEVDATDSIISE